MTEQMHVRVAPFLSGRAMGFRRWIVAILAGALFIWLWAGRKDGLYNNITDDAAALERHERAWHDMYASTDIDRIGAQALARGEDMACITGEAQFERVPLDRQVDSRLIAGRVPIECHVQVRGRWPAAFPGGFIWTSVFVATGPDSLRLVETRRQRVPS